MRMPDGWVPDAGDVLWVDFGGGVGHEHAGRRPALILSPKSYNERSSVLVVCPISRKADDWPFKFEIPAVGKITGFVLLDQIRVVDPTARHCRFAGHISLVALGLVRQRLAALLGIGS